MGHIEKISRTRTFSEIGVQASTWSDPGAAGAFVANQGDHIFCPKNYSLHATHCSAQIVQRESEASSEPGQQNDLWLLFGGVLLVNTPTPYLLVEGDQLRPLAMGFSEQQEIGTPVNQYVPENRFDISEDLRGRQYSQVRNDPGKQRYDRTEAAPGFAWYATSTGGAQRMLGFLHAEFDLIWNGGHGGSGAWTQDQLDEEAQFS